MNKKKNFHIVRHYEYGKVQFATQLTKKQATQYLPYFEQAHNNEAGGLTMWYRIDIL